MAVTTPEFVEVTWPLSWFQTLVIFWKE